MNLMKQVLTDNNEKLSTKRLIVMILVVLLSVVIIAHVFFGKTIADYVYEGLIEAVIWSMGFIGSEKFVEAIPTFMNNRRQNRTTTTKVTGSPKKPEDYPDDSEADSI